MSLETVSLENKSVSALNVADNTDGIYIYLYTALAISTTLALFCNRSLYFLLEDTVNHVL